MEGEDGCWQRATFDSLERRSETWILAGRSVDAAFLDRI